MARKKPASAEPGEVTYDLPLPPSANNIWRHITVGGRPRTLLSREYRDWLKVASLAVQIQGRVSPAEPVEVLAVLCGGDGFSRSSDLDNRTFKPCLDLLRKAGVLRNDNLTCVTRLVARYEKVRGPSRVVVTVRSVQQEADQ